MSFETPPKKDSSHSEKFNKDIKSKLEDNKEEVEGNYEELGKSIKEIRKDFRKLVEVSPDPESLSPLELELYGNEEAVEQLVDNSEIPESESSRLKKERRTKELAEKYQKYEQGFFEFKNNKTQEAIRNQIGESFGFNFSSNFIENPDEVDPSINHEPWYDIMATAGYAWSRSQEDLSNLSKEQKEEYASIAKEVEKDIEELLSKTDKANPEALEYGIRKVSDKTKEFIWEQIKNKYSDEISNRSLESIIKRNADKNFAKEAWKILSSRADIPLISLLRISKNAEGTPKREAASKLLSELESLEKEAEEKNQEAINKLKRFGYKKHPEQYQRTKKNLESISS
ncbi:MAG: hypothetical protein ABEI53_02550 [Candidatus Magasanikbacteria bacterium]